MTPATSDDEFLALWPRLQAVSDTFHDLEKRGAPDEETGPVEEELSALQHRIACEPVTTPAGLAAKLRLIADEIPADSKKDFPQAVIQSALECAERMVGRRAVVTAHPHGTDVPAPWQAYVDYSKMLNQMPRDVDISEAQSARLNTLVERMLESQPKNITELAAKTAALELCNEHSGTTGEEALKSIEADIRRLAGGEAVMGEVPVDVEKLR